MTNVNDVYLISLLVEAWISRVPGAGSAEGASSPSQPGAPLQGAAPEPKKGVSAPLAVFSRVLLMPVSVPTAGLLATSSSTDFPVSASPRNLHWIIAVLRTFNESP